MAVGYAYAVNTGQQTISAATTLVAIRAGAAAGIRVLRVSVTQSGSATSGKVRVQIGRKAAALATGLTSVTPEKLDPKAATSLIVGGTTVAAGTVGVFSTSEGAGTFTPIYSENFNNLNGYLWVPGLGEDLISRAGDATAIVVRIPTAPTGTTLWEACMIYEEI